MALYDKHFTRRWLGAIFFVACLGFVPSASADVSGSWDFAVTLGQLGSGNAAVTLNQEAEGKLSGSYSGQLGQTDVTGTWEGNNFEFSFPSAALGGDITYRGAMQEDGTLSGTVVMGGQDAGTFTAAKT
jgi:hypothetical protein